MINNFDTSIGERDVWGGGEPFGLLRADRRQHVYIVGQTGTGKSSLLRNILLQDIEAGEGVGLLDPHGEMAESIIDSIPPWRTDDVVYFNPADTDYPIGLNLFQNVPIAHRPRVASGVISAMKGLWRDSWGPRLEYILYAAIVSLLDCEGTTILGISRLLADGRYRRSIVRHVRDPMVRAFWSDEFDKYDKRFLAEAIAPIQNKVGRLVMNASIRNVVGQVRKKMDLRFMMDRKRIFIANLSKGKLGDDASNFLGSLIVTGFELAAMGRASMPEEDRTDFHLAVDEFHSFTTDSFATILAEARKYRLSITLCHQHGGQLRESVRDAVFGNVGTLFSFRVGRKDAEGLAREFGGGYSPDAFTALGNYRLAVKLLTRGTYMQPFFATTQSPIRTRVGRTKTVVDRSREKYATRRHVVEGKIERWINRPL